MSTPFEMGQLVRFDMVRLKTHILEMRVSRLDVLYYGDPVVEVTWTEQGWEKSALVPSSWLTDWFADKSAGANESMNGQDSALGGYWRKPYLPLLASLLVLGLVMRSRGDFSIYVSLNCCWFRILGCGLGFYDRRRRTALYSERTGKTKVWKLGPIVVKPLGWRGNT